MESRCSGEFRRRGISPDPVRRPLHSGEGRDERIDTGVPDSAHPRIVSGPAHPHLPLRRLRPQGGILLAAYGARRPTKDRLQRRQHRRHRRAIGAWKGVAAWDVSTGDPIVPSPRRVTIDRILGEPASTPTNSPLGLGRHPPPRRHPQTHTTPSRLRRSRTSEVGRMAQGKPRICLR